MSCSTSDLRSAFLDFFQQKGHALCPSASLVPHHDPSLLFTTAGMVPFKDIFTGRQKRPFPSATSCQKCVRAGGKHNDLEQVGHTARHHTFFEMLGNFSFGDYFKEEAIVYAWEFLTKVLGLPKEKLWITVYHTDEEAWKLWGKIAGIPETRMIRIATSDNFWSAGDTGPCGPCSEIFYDHGEGIPGGPPGSPEAEGDRFVEVWNLVFMELEQIGPGERVFLPSPSIDTGMGLERLAAVMQGVCDNFETDLFRSLIRSSQELALGQEGEASRVAHRIIADHLRSSSFLIADGVLPSNEGRGYVLRRIIRRALRHVQHLGGASFHLARLVPTLVREMGGHYLELVQARSLIESVLEQEGQRFEGLLSKGLELLSEWIKTDHLEKGSIFSGDKAFQLYDTYGFPLDLTQDILKEKGIQVDEERFYQGMDQQRQQSRQSWVGSGAAVASPLWMQLNEKIESTQFIGYIETSGSGIVQLLLHQDQEVQELAVGQEGFLISNVSPFYGESGGQVGDTGWISSASGLMEVTDTQKRGNLLVHHGVIKEGSILKGESISLEIHLQRRKALQIHHSATHLLQSALRALLGPHVVQKGSLVAEDKLRFDFSHHKTLTPEQLDQIEDLVNQNIQANFPVSAMMMDQKEAIQSGAMALFGEKYDAQVRVVSMEEASRELCGGTHVSFTGSIGIFKIISEGSVASGIRRIEAVAGPAAVKFYQALHHQIKALSSQLKVPSSHLSEKIAQLTKRKSAPPPSVAPVKERAGEIDFWHAYVSHLDSKGLKEAMEHLRQQVKSGVIVLVSTAGEKMITSVGVTKDLTSRWQGPVLLSRALGEFGSSGGRPEAAQGGSRGLSAEEVIARIKEELTRGG